MSSPDRLLTATEVARYFRLHVMTIYRMIQRRELPAVRVGRQWRFRRSRIDRWLQEQGRADGQLPHSRGFRRQG